MVARSQPYLPPKVLDGLSIRRSQHQGEGLGQPSVMGLEGPTDDRLANQGPKVSGDNDAEGKAKRTVNQVVWESHGSSRVDPGFDPTYAL
jgi:hypothetical protein